MDKCSNCGEEVNLNRAQAERQKKGWCVSCFKTWHKTGGEYGKEKVRTLYTHTGFDSRAVY